MSLLKSLHVLIGVSLSRPGLSSYPGTRSARRGGFPGEGPFYFLQQCDHFQQGPAQGYCTFKQRYFLNTTFWIQGGPILFSPGGEGPVDFIYYDFMRELAALVGGAILFGEHRYYGQSLPFGNEESFLPTRMGLLTIEQAMEDYARLIRSVQTKLGCLDPYCPVVSMGGSYSGKLSAYLRLKFPDVVDMALASSAPIYLDSPDLHNVSQFAFYKIVTEAAAKVSPHCPGAVRIAYAALDVFSPAEISRQLNLCVPLDGSKEALLQLKQRIMNQFADLAMGNYPPSSSSLKRYCQQLLDGESGLPALVRFLDDNYHHPPEGGFSSAKCYNVTSAAPSGMHGQVVCSDWSGCGSGTQGEAWDYQACTEVIQPLGSNNVTDMFWPRTWTLQWQTTHCQQRFLATPFLNGQWLAQTMGLHDISKTGLKRIIFSNGDQDPWSAGGVLQSISPSLIAILIPGAAHHNDLDGTRPYDTSEMIAARREETNILMRWLVEVRQERRNEDRFVDNIVQVMV